MFGGNPKRGAAFRWRFSWIPGIEKEDGENLTGLAKRGRHRANIIDTLCRQNRAETGMLKDPIESPNQLCRQPEQVCANVALIAGLGMLFSLGQSQWRNIETNDTGVWRCHRDCPHIVAQPASRNENVAGERAVSRHPGKQRRCRRPFVPRHLANSVEFVPVGHVIGYRLQDVVKTSVTLSEVLGFLFIASLIRSGSFRFVW